MAYLREVINGNCLEVHGSPEMVEDVARQFHLKIIDDAVSAVDKERTRLNRSRRGLKSLQQRLRFGQSAESAS